MTSIKWRFKLGQATTLFTISVIALGLSLWLFDANLRRGISVIVAVTVIALLQIILQPLLRWLSRSLGLVGVALVCLFSSTLIVWLALSLVPGIDLQSPWDGLFVAWSYAFFITLTQWIFVSRSDELFLHEIVRINPKPRLDEMSDNPGYVFIQLDGVSAPLLDWQLKAGNLPNISRLISDEGYIFDSWRAQLPATTPASQAGILLGSNRDIPGFRWYEKDSGQMIIANDPQGAAVIEQRHSRGSGLLAKGGVSVGNLFTGDAPANYMVMSRLSGRRESIRRLDSYSGYFSSPAGYMRSIILAIGEAIKEVYQARRQVALDIRPRIDRRLSFVVQRVGTSVILRYLQTYIVVSNMLAGVNSLYVDYLDYDEIAHHAGIARPEALHALAGIDASIGIIGRARQYARRPYRIILVSDHGQSQGPPFRQLHQGKTLHDIVDKYTGAQNGIVTTGSGNLGGIWFKDLPGRASYEDIMHRYPDVINGLLNTAGIGIVLATLADGRHVCLSAHGAVILESASPFMTECYGSANPWAQYQYADSASLLRLAAMPSAPDLTVMASYDDNSGETYGFEELVGIHGGYGGWQTEAILLHPPELVLPARYRQQPIIGAESLHRILKRWSR